MIQLRPCFLTQGAKHPAYTIVVKTREPEPSLATDSDPHNHYDCNCKSTHNHPENLPFRRNQLCHRRIGRQGHPPTDRFVASQATRRAKYKWPDVVLGLIYGVFCGADRLEDMETLKHLMHNSSLSIPSSDQIAATIKKHLKVSNEDVVSVNKKTKTENHYDININAPLNNLMLEIALKLGAI